MTRQVAPALAGTRLTIARTEEEVEQLREGWLALQGDAFMADPDYYLALLRADPRRPAPFVIVLERDGAPAAIVVARLEDRRLPNRIGYKTVYRPRVRTLTVVYGGCLGHDLAEDAPLLAGELLAALDRRKAVAVYLPNLPRDSPLRTALARSVSFPAHLRVGPVKTHWRLTLPDSLEEFIASKPSRSRGRIRRYPRRFLDEFGARHRLRVFRDPADLDQLFRDTEKVAALTYQRGLGSAFVDDEMSRSLVAFAMERGWFRGYLLYIDDEPSAYWFGSAYGGLFRTGVTGYAPSFADSHPGTYLLMQMIEDQCQDPGIRAIDYGFGDAEYKHTFGTDAWEEADVLLFGPTLRGTWLGIATSAISGLDGAARRVAGGSLAARVKRAWRQRLRSSGS